jgi:hypothetical protein
MMKKFLFAFAILLETSVLANMANPVTEGTLGARPFVSQYVDVIHEDLSIKIDENFEFATFNVKYHINSSSEGFQIPFLFYASQYLDSFTVTIDGTPVNVQTIPDDVILPEESTFKDFSFLQSPSDTDKYYYLNNRVHDLGFHYSLVDLIYFETDISKGEHVIEVNYRATKWTDQWDWINEYSFRYALSPAKYWKSFGTLHVDLDASSFNQVLSSNLGDPTSGNLKTTAHWEFDKLPVDVLQITYVPEVDETTQTLMKLGPMGLALIASVFLVIIHLVLIIWHRSRNPSKRFSIPVIAGSLMIPLFFVLTWMYSYNFIDSYIGEHAGRTHGYTFLLLGLYVFITPFYWGINWLIDKDLKKKHTKN